MALDPNRVELTKFEQLEILRHEEETLTEKSRETERAIADIQYQVARLRYLQSVDPYYHLLPPPEGLKQLPEWEKMRRDVTRALEAVRTQISLLEADASVKAGPPPGTPRPRVSSESPRPSNRRPPAEGPPGRRPRFEL